MLGIRKYQSTAIDLYQGDITQFVCNAMVNAANSELKGGGGVDGAIHQRGGPSIMDECKKHGSCPTGSAVVTSAGNLPCQWIIHTVGPIWNGGGNQEHSLLHQAYTSSLRKASDLAIRHIALPSLSTGTYNYPLQEAAEIAMLAMKGFLDDNEDTSIKRITFVLFNGPHHDAYQDSMGKVFPE